MLDAAYSHYAAENDYTDGIQYVKEGFPIVVLQTFSKVYGLAGLRVGFGLASPAITANIQKVREPFNVNALAQVAAIARSASNFILIQISDDAEVVYAKLLQSGIIVRHGGLWGLTHHLRITVGTKKDIEA